MGSKSKRARDDADSPPDVRTPATTPNPTTSTTKPLSLKQQCFLQALLSRGMMVVDDAEELYRRVRVDAVTRVGVFHDEEGRKGRAGIETMGD